MQIANKHKIYVVEDAAQAIDSYYKGRPLGSIGHLSAFSFHETKNIISGEGGALLVNNPKFIKRAQIIKDKGTDRFNYLNRFLNIEEDSNIQELNEILENLKAYGLIESMKAPKGIKMN